MKKFVLQIPSHQKMDFGQASLGCLGTKDEISFVQVNSKFDAFGSFFFAACHKEIKNVSLQKIIKFLNVHFFPQQEGCIPKHFANDESVKGFGTAHIVSCPTNDFCRLHLAISILNVSEIDLDI